MVQAVDVKEPGVGQSGEAGAGCDPQVMDRRFQRQILEMADRAARLQVLDQAAAQGDIEDLGASADAEYGHVQVGRGGDGVDLQSVEVFVDDRLGVHLLSETAGMRIDSAGQEQAVDVFHHVPDRRVVDAGRDGDRYRS
jgi:hypothetical protein